MAERLLLGAMAAVDGSLTRWEAEYAGLRERGAAIETGVVGAYRDVLPADALRDATTSVYAEIAHRLGWLDLDRALSEGEYQRLNFVIGDWATQDRTLSEVIETFGPPSLAEPGFRLACRRTRIRASGRTPVPAGSGPRPTAMR